MAKKTVNKETVPIVGYAVVDEVPTYAEVKEVVIEPIIDTEVVQKQKYEKYLIDAKTDIDRVVDSAGTAFHSLSKQQLLDMALIYPERPFNYEPKTVGALTFEMGKKGLEKEAKELMKKLESVDWFIKPWLRF